MLRHQNTPQLPHTTPLSTILPQHTPPPTMVNSHPDIISQDFHTYNLFIYSAMQLVIL